MAATQPCFSLSDFPPEMVKAVAVDAALDAERVSAFLDTLGFPASPEKPVPMPARFLLHLGAALRLLTWERQGFTFHRAAGLPTARQALRDAFRSLEEPGADPTELCVAVVRLSIERFAWHGQADLDAHVALDDLTDEAALNALAEYLWASRHQEAVAGGPQP